MAIFSANTAEINQAGRTISNLGDNYKTNVSNIFSTIDTLSKSWSGGASERYVTAFNSYKPDLNNLGTTITNMGAALQSAAASFDDNEADLTARAGNL